MDCVILAAGKGERLSGTAARFHKPLMCVNGKPMIVQVVEAALAAETSHVVIVVAPSNVGPIIDLIEANGLADHGVALTYIVQPTPNGPGGALLLAARALCTEQVLVLMGDNILHKHDVLAVCDQADAHELVIGVRSVHDSDQAARFTRVRANGTTTEGPDVNTNDEWTDGEYKVWCGPLIIPNSKLVKALQAHDTNGEIKIGPYLGELGISPHLVEVDAVDIGIPTEVQ